MSSTIDPAELAAAPRASRPDGTTLFELAPLVTAIAVGLLLVAARKSAGPVGPLDDGSTVVLALIAYICSAVLHMTHVYVRLPWIRRAGVGLAAAGLASNVASWGIRWIQAGEAESWSQWLWRYVPLANLYDITVAFVFVSVIFTLAIERKPRHAAVGAITMPVAALLLMLAVFLGNEQRTLQPILDSYWRPIHVGIAATSYGVCLVSFGLAILYLVRDRVPMSSIAAWVAAIGAGAYLCFDRFGVLTASYSSSLFAGGSPVSLYGGGTLRVLVPGAGAALLVAFLSLLATAAVLGYAALAERADLRALGMKLLVASIVVQALAVSFVLWRVTTLDDLAARAVAVPSETLRLAGAKMAETTGLDPRQMEAARLTTGAKQALSQSDLDLDTNVRSNPIEFAAMISVLAACLIVSVLAYKPERVAESLPSLKTLDRLQYLAVSICFPLLTLLLITGAVWANESWGRYWGWDNKEVGALVTWLAYAAYLHTRIAHGWTGRRSAYVAVGGFALVIFTYLGVSYLLPGLHSYAS